MSRRERVELLLTWNGARRLGARSRRVGGWFADRLWFTPWSTGATETSRRRESQWLATTRPFTATTSAGRLHGFTAGDGPVVLLVHGWGDHAARLGAFVAPLVATGHRVVGIDLPGHGANRRRRTTLPEFAAALRDTAEQLGGVHAVIAHSIGGAATVLALGGGLTARRVVLLAPAVRLEHAVDRFATMFALPPLAADGLRGRIERRFGATVWDDFAADRVAADITIPALIVHDADDPQVDLADSRQLAAAWPGARLIETSGLGHHRALRRPEVIDAAVAFVAGDARGRHERSRTAAAS